MNFLATLIIDVDRDKDKKTVDLTKPKDKGFWDDSYTIESPIPSREWPAVNVFWSTTFPRPVVLEFVSNEAITGIGFSRCRGSIEYYNRVGPCGGCFFLRTDLTKRGKKNVAVENWGEAPEGGYHFSFLFGDGGTFDPQIYNQGVIFDPDGEPRKWNIFRRLLWRLVRLFRSAY